MATPSYTKHLLFSSLTLLSTLVFAQAQPAEQITVTGRINASPLQAGGFGDVPLAKSPFAASLLGEEQLRDVDAHNLSDLTRLDAAISDAYNAEGYWQSLTVRGFVIDNRFNYRRDGLPVNAEAVLPMANKSSLELLKGTSGIQAGTSAPGGLVNLVVKRPTRNLTSAGLEWKERGSVGAYADISRRFGTDEAFGVRINAEARRIDPQVRDAQGHANLLAVAADWRITPRTLLEVEGEHSRQSQPSVPGFSLLGSVLPNAKDVDPRINLNNQPWSQPVVFTGNTGSVRLTQQLSDDWRVSAHGMTQRLTNDDRVAFPFGCSAENNFSSYCSDGTFDYYDFRSDREKRRSSALDLQLAGTLRTGGVTHSLSTGVMFTRFESRLGGQAYNWVGVGTVDGNTVVPADPTLAYTNTNRTERSTEAYVRDVMQLSPEWGLWAGLRHTRLHRDSVQTDGSEPTAYGQGVTTPWLALAWQATLRTLAYASWGEGMETEVAPNLPLYTNHGQALPALKSKQVELGVKHSGEVVDASAAVFNIERPQASDIGACDVDASCERRIDGQSRHRGVEALVSWRMAAGWQLHASGLWLKAERRGSADPSINGLRPTNVANNALRLLLQHDVAALPGLSLVGGVVHEGRRMVVPDNSVAIPAWTRVDALARYTHTVGTGDGAARLTWRLGVDNLADKRAWKEAPYQYGHAYLFPMAPRTVRVSVNAEL
jgi:iron complex outermembrane receptor protein